MQEELPECFRVVSQQRTCGDEAVGAALEDIHKFVFEKSQRNMEALSPSELLSSCDLAVKKVGGQLGKRNPLGIAHLPMGVAIVEMIARLTRILFWGIAACFEMSLPRRLKMIEEDGEELEEVLLPRFFLKLSVSPTILRDVLMKAPWDVFSRLYGTENALPGEVRECVPLEVISVLNSLKVNFGCDFLFHISVPVDLAGSHPETNNTAAEAIASHMATAFNLGGGLSVAVEADGDNKSIGDDTNHHLFSDKRCSRSSVLGRSTSRSESWDFKTGRKPLSSSGERSQVTQLIHSRHCLPAYKLTRRRSGILPGRGAGIVCADYPISGAGHYSPATEEDHVSSEEHDAEAEVLAPETPVKKRVRAEKGVVPPSPSRPTRE
ncbi:hypothetical protein MOQ_002223 [Trypanosoma cruzi marinkellei]|uniref:Uncharacterized protein n=1 Tax=Trypanosoma cruzi marinkellei TaxID=85056 RepID=K2MQR7_TRYCR|nr:hypothetical protein MOQ_002223 [Trypanosoma cruzi marinkellei]